MFKRLMAVLAALALSLGLAVMAAPAAQAGNCSVINGRTYCGKVWNHSQSNGYLQITNTWPTPSNVRVIYAGQVSTKWFTDTDGFRVQPGCNGWGGLPNNPPMYHGGTWYKINDTFSGTIRVTC